MSTPGELLLLLLKYGLVQENAKKHPPKLAPDIKCKLKNKPAPPQAGKKSLADNYVSRMKQAWVGLFFFFLSSEHE